MDCSATDTLGHRNPASGLGEAHEVKFDLIDARDLHPALIQNDGVLHYTDIAEVVGSALW